MFYHEFFLSPSDMDSSSSKGLKWKNLLPTSFLSDFDKSTPIVEGTIVYNP